MSSHYGSMPAVERCAISIHNIRHFCVFNITLFNRHNYFPFNGFKHVFRMSLVLVLVLVSSTRMIAMDRGIDNAKMNMQYIQYVHTSLRYGTWKVR